MTLGWNDHPEAREEFLDAHERYLGINIKLGDEFADEAERAAELIILWPDSPPPPYRGQMRKPIVRTWHLGKFPYNLVYTVQGREIFVLAYAHESRRPGYWKKRLTDLVD